MHRLSRRDFIARTVAASSTVALCGGSALPVLADGTPASPIVVFSKVYQELKLSFDDAAAVTAEADRTRAVPVPTTAPEEPRGEWGRSAEAS